MAKLMLLTAPQSRLCRIHSMRRGKYRKAEFL
jgi:hypothetical protein